MFSFYRSIIRYNCHIDFPHAKNFLFVPTDYQKSTKSYYKDTSHGHFCHKLFAEHNILPGIFILLTNYCDLPVFDQISLFFFRKNLKSPGLENLRLTSLHMCKWLAMKLYSTECYASSFVGQNYSPLFFR